MYLFLQIYLKQKYCRFRSQQFLQFIIQSSICNDNQSNVYGWTQPDRIKTRQLIQRLKSCLKPSLGRCFFQMFQNPQQHDNALDACDIIPILMIEEINNQLNNFREQNYQNAPHEHEQLFQQVVRNYHLRRQNSQQSKIEQPFLTNQNPAVLSQLMQCEVFLVSICAEDLNYRMFKPQQNFLEQIQAFLQVLVFILIALLIIMSVIFFFINYRGFIIPFTRKWGKLLKRKDIKNLYGIGRAILLMLLYIGAIKINNKIKQRIHNRRHKQRFQWYMGQVYYAIYGQEQVVQEI